MHTTRSAAVAVAVAFLSILSLLGLDARPAAAAVSTGSLDASKDVTWVESGTTRRLRASMGLTVNDYGAYGTIHGYLKGQTFGQSNYKICTAGTITLYAKIGSPSSLRPELNKGWQLVDIQVVSAGNDKFIFKQTDCRANSTTAGWGYGSQDPIRWSSSTWRVYKVSAVSTTWNTFRDGRVAYQVTASTSASV